MPNDQKVYCCDPDDVTVLEGRQRKDYDIKEMRRLEASIVRLGQLQPGVCRRDQDQVVLIAGYRRLMACKNLDLEYAYVLLDEIEDQVMREEMELHENLMRENLSFQDEAAARANLHALYSKTRGTGTIKGKTTWGIEKTAHELGIGKTTLRDDVEISRFAEKVPAVALAKTRSEAKKIIGRLKNTVLQDEAIKQIKQSETDACELGEGEERSLEDTLTCAVKEFSKTVHCGEFESVLDEKFEPETFDIVFFDPPWGVKFDDVFQLSGNQQGYSDNRKSFFKNLEGWLTKLYEFMKPDSHLYLKFGIVSHFWVVRTLRRAGFETNGIPIIWRKSTAHRTRNPEKYPGRCYEPIMLAHKGKKPIQLQGRQDYIETPAPTQKMKDIHPSAMHPKVPYELLQRSAFPGDRVLDPMAGSGMFAVAAEGLRDSLQLQWTIIEKEKSFCNLAIKNLLTGYRSIAALTELDDEVGDFRTLKPGSPEWISYWNNHEDKREEMMQFSKGE